VEGFVFEIADSLVSWSLKKQPTVTTSLVEAKFIAFSNAIKETMLMRIDYRQ